jgi:hypothetical protein
MAEQPGPSLARRQQAGKHLHRRGLAAPVGAEEAEDFTAPDAEGHAVDGNEVAKAHGQPLGLDGDIVRAVLRQGGNDYRLVSALFLFREQADECLFQVRAACSSSNSFGVPVARTLPSSMAASQSKRWASSM